MGLAIFIYPWQIQHRTFNQSHKHCSSNRDYGPQYLCLATLSPNIYCLKSAKAFTDFWSIPIFSTSIMYACTNVNGTKKNYPKIQAIKNANAGTTLHRALEKVAVVYLSQRRASSGLLQAWVGENESLSVIQLSQKKKKKESKMFFFFWSLKAKA